MGNRCAVVIGVSRTGGQPPLVSPIPGAKSVERLFRENGYDVECITDEAEPVTVVRIATAISGFIDQQPVKGYRLLVVYFSGHGFIRNGSDLWLLSNAPVNANEAVNMLESSDLAGRCSSIDNVVLISDACRSMAQSEVDRYVCGSQVFPNRDCDKTSIVDMLLGSQKGKPTYEANIGENGGMESVFTHCFLDAFKNPDPDMIEPQTEGGVTISVVPNRRLRNFIIRDVVAVLEKFNPTLRQDPDIEVVSDDDVYMARVQTAPGTGGSPNAPPAMQSPPQPDLSPADVAIANTFDLKIDAGGRLVLPPTSPTARMAVITRSSLIRHAFDATLAGGARPAGDDQLNEIVNAPPPGSQKRRSRESSFLRDLSKNFAAGGFGPASAKVTEFESGVGFTVTGETIEDAVITGPHDDHYGNHIDVLERGGEKKTGIVSVRLDKTTAASSVLLVVSNGRGVPLAALAGYIGHILIGDGRVQNISYIPIKPTRGQPAKTRWDIYLANKGQLERLRALAVTAIAGNSFRIGDVRRAKQLANVIRSVKAIDPMLGLFATYAYLEAGHEQELQNVRQYMRDDLDAELFDVAMLATSDPVRQIHPPLRRVPFCPILTRGWNYLRSRKIQLPAEVVNAQNELVPGPFTMFEPETAKTVFYALSRGELDGV
jgi:hypothetical protein